MKKIPLILCATLLSPLLMGETLTLNQAVDYAMRNNRLIKIAQDETSKAEARLDSAKTLRYPLFKVDALGSRLLDPVNFTFAKGSLGTIPGVGPFPVTDTQVNVATKYNLAVMGSVTEPIFQQYKIHLGIKALELGKSIAEEELKARKLAVATDVKKAYFPLLWTQQALDASLQAEEAYREALREADQYLKQEAILPADYLEIKARLSRQEYGTMTAENAIKTLREQLNQLLGLDLDADTRVADEKFPEPEIKKIEDAIATAMQKRPEVRQADMRNRQAQYDLKIKKAAYIPDMSLMVSHTRFADTQYIPNNFSSAGLLLSWDIFDWGKKGAEVDEKRYQASQASQGLNETRKKVEQEVRLKYRHLQEAAKLAEVSGLEAEASRERLRVAENRFEQNAIKPAEMLQAKAKTAEADYQEKKAVMDKFTAQAEFYAALGVEE